MNMYTITIFCLILIVLALLYFRSFKNDMPTCDNYTTNVYLYVLLGLLFISFTILFMEKTKSPVTMTKSIVALAVAILLVWFLVDTPAENIVTTHALWLGLMICLAVMFYSIYEYSQYRGTLIVTGITVFLITAILTLLVYLRPEIVTLNMASMAFLGLGALLGITIVSFLYGVPINMPILGWLTIFVFGLLLLVDTRILIEHGEVCTFPNYPLDSVNLILDGAGIVSGVTKVI